MTPVVRHLFDIPPQPWKNGLGLTRELLTLPAGGDWSVRISVADVTADGPFSIYPGIERWFAVIEGAGVRLEIDGVTHDLAPVSPPLRFDGAAPTTCRLADGPTRDLNLMLRGSPGAIHGIANGTAWMPAQSACGLLTRHGGTCMWSSGRIALAPWSFAWFDAAPASLVFTPGDPAEPPAGWWIEAAVPARADERAPMR